MYEAEELSFQNVHDASKAVKSIDVSDECVRIMSPKAVFTCIKLHGVRNAVANILKQEMISAKGDATVSQYTVNCAKEKTDVLLMGTIAQYLTLISKMRLQGYYLGEKKVEYEGVCEAIEKILKSRLQKK